MGGGGGGGFRSSDLERLEQKAKQSLKDASADVSPHVFISFAYEDRDEVNLLRGQAKNDKTELQFDDYSVKDAFDSKNSDYIKQQIRDKMEKTSVTLVYLSPESAKSKWVDWEIRESLKREKGVVGVYKGDKSPIELPTAFKEFRLPIVKWTHEDITKAIDKARKSK